MSEFEHRLPIKVDSTSNGEFAPIPLSPLNRQANSLAREAIGRDARRAGMDRRKFLVSACAAASTLLTFNRVQAQAGAIGGRFELADDAAVDPQLAAEQLGGREFIFDVQGHFVNPQGAWLKNLPASARPLRQMPKAGCALGDEPGDRSYLQCLGSQEFIKDVFLDSDTDMIVLSFVPSRRDAEPLTIEEAAETQAIVERMDGTHRLMVHGRVNPNQDGDLEGMDELAERYRISAWKTYTQWGPDGKGFFLHDDVGIAFIEKARSLGIRNICIHKGLPFGQESYEHSLCDDIGVVAKRFPDVNFLVYHSGFVPGQPEREFRPERNEGIDSLIKTVVDNELGTNSNVYAELGSTWRYLLRDPDSAAHGLGKLFKYIGEDNVLWGTDSIWYGSPQDQIQAFRTFQIGEQLREQFGYPEITPELRAKVFGLNAMKPYNITMEEVLQRAGNDRVALERQNYLNDPRPHYKTYGPKTRREFLNLLRASGGSPG
ncbi:amidohydrolase family protein [Gilvimarinus sp. F26214L]|uniref:amidohydrolase family protein n=1 Tax=Gilvimarinus sp. DZF01 TaxID=3461371 RepID=UPI00404597EB